jgi:hypothetical protein
MKIRTMTKMSRPKFRGTAHGDRMAAEAGEAVVPAGAAEDVVTSAAADPSGIRAVVPAGADGISSAGDLPGSKCQ